ncbi:glutathione S-transferase family protein [Pendulispora albinea]|uniref:Glutathione S-transferase C-terminal domain-containing protein n=1 Tax=Pendulispora albinea TaxID=2741071 RepID=A0ABZ2M2X2_9BACT
MTRLITIPFSHYCEKARWVLDRNGVAYDEERYMPTFHFPAAMRALVGRGKGLHDRASTRFSTPILIGDGVLLTDSSEIVRHVEPRLFEDPEAQRLDAYFGDELGPHSRLIVYWHALKEPRLLFELADTNVSRQQALLFRRLYPIVATMVRTQLRIDEAAYRRSLERVRRIADDVALRLADGRPFLLGDRFSAADLAFAALFAPAILPGCDVYGAKLPAPKRFPPEAQSFVREHRDHPAGRFAMRMFREERHRRT